jgi:hypothetical protein
MKTSTLRFPALLLALACGGCASSDWQSDAGRILEQIQGQPGAAAALNDSEIVAGLREALAQGTTRAINQLGRTDGFWGDAGVRVPLPDPLTRYERTLRQYGQGARLDAFQLTLNRAAEQAVPQVADIFGAAVRQMSIADARAILSGQPDAATQYFRRVSSESLRQKILPIVQGATARVGVTQSYKQLMGQAGPVLQLAGYQAPDLDSFVTQKALDGLFVNIAAEEARIRQNPAARGSELLRKVFGAR